MPARTSPYETLGHVVCGLLIIGACEAAHDGRWLVDRPWPAGRVSLYLTAAYAVGQFVAGIARLVIEQGFVGRLLGYPENVLLADERHGRRSWRTVLFASYCAPLPPADRINVLTDAARDGVAESKAEIFDRAFDVAVRDESIYKHLDATLRQAWAWRNLCMGLLIVAAILISGMCWHSVSASWGKSDWRKLGYCALALAEAGVLFYRYLKFYRLHAVDVFGAYARARGG